MVGKNFAAVTAFVMMGPFFLSQAHTEGVLVWNKGVNFIHTPTEIDPESVGYPKGTSINYYLHRNGNRYFLAEYFIESQRVQAEEVFTGGSLEHQGEAELQLRETKRSRLAFEALKREFPSIIKTDPKTIEIHDHLYSFQKKKKIALNFHQAVVMGKLVAKSHADAIPSSLGVRLNYILPNSANITRQVQSQKSTQTEVWQIQSSRESYDFRPETVRDYQQARKDFYSQPFQEFNSETFRSTVKEIFMIVTEDPSGLLASYMTAYGLDADQMADKLVGTTGPHSEKVPHIASLQGFGNRVENIFIHEINQVQNLPKIDYSDEVRRSFPNFLNVRNWQTEETRKSYKEGFRVALKTSDRLQAFVRRQSLKQEKIIELWNQYVDAMIDGDIREYSGILWVSLDYDDGLIYGLRSALHRYRRSTSESARDAYHPRSVFQTSTYYDPRTEKILKSKVFLFDVNNPGRNKQ